MYNSISYTNFFGIFKKQQESLQHESENNMSKNERMHLTLKDEERRKESHVDLLKKWHTRMLFDATPTLIVDSGKLSCAASSHRLGLET